MPDGAISFPILGDFYVNPTKYFSLGSLKIHWYGVIIATGFLLAVIYCSHRAPEFGLTADHIYDVILWGLPMGIIFGRAYYVVFYWELFEGTSLLNIIAVWNGGIAMYGVILGALLTLIVYAHRHKLPLTPFLDDIMLGFIIGQFIGRWGNFINRECYGYETTLPWRMGLTQGGVTTYVHPTFLYESLWNFVGFILIHTFSKKHRRYDGQIFLLYSCWYGFGRMLVEGLRTDSLYLFNTGIRVSQLVAGLSFVIAGVLLLINRFVIKHDPQDMFVYRSLRQAGEADGAEDKGSSENDSDRQ